jgi:hypothetical protein
VTPLKHALPLWKTDKIAEDSVQKWQQEAVLVILPAEFLQLPEQRRNKVIARRRKDRTDHLLQFQRTQHRSNHAKCLIS